MQYERIITDVVGLIRYISDFSNLYLDPHIGSTYLADINFVMIPNVEMLIPKISIHLEGLKNLQTKTLNFEDRYLLSSWLALLEAYQEETRTGIEKALNEDQQQDNNTIDIESKIRDPLDCS